MARTIDYNAFNKVEKIVEGDSTLEFLYGPDNSLLKQLSSDSSQKEETAYIGGLYEKQTGPKFRGHDTKLM